MEKYLPFLAILTPIVVFWKQFQSWLIRIFRIFVKTRVIDERIAIPFYKYLQENYFSYSFDNYVLQSAEAYNKTTNKLEYLYVKSKINTVVLYKKFIPVFFSPSSNGEVAFTYLKGTFPFEKLMERFISEINDRNIERTFYYVSSLSGSLNDSSKSESSRNQETVMGNTWGSDGSARGAFPPQSTTLFSGVTEEISQKLADSINGDINNYCLVKQDEERNKYSFTEEGLYVKSLVEKWKNSKQWYTDRGIRYYRGCCIYSKPGLGKSSLINEIAKRLELPLYIFDLSSMTNREFIGKVDRLSKMPGLILFEDFDCIFNKRDNINKTEERGGLTFDCFINKLSGAQAVENKYVFITTNHLEALDPAVLRPGRIDDLIELTGLNDKEKSRIAQIIVGKNVDEIVRLGANDTPAEFENRCVKIALDNYWNANTEKT